MSQSLAINFSIGDLRFTFGDAHIISGVAAYRLRVPVDITAAWMRPGDSQITMPVGLTGSIEMAPPVSRWLGTIAPQTIVVRNYRTSEHIEVSLSDNQLLALDRYRGEDSLLLYFRFQATLLGPGAPDFPVSQTEGPLTIDALRWTTLLDQLSSEISFQLRVPAPMAELELADARVDVEDVPSLTKASVRLRQARAQFRSHSWEQCVGTCRQVLESLGQLESFPAANSFMQTKAQARTQAQRWAAIYYDLLSMASAAHHDDATTADFTWRRSDAEAILVATAAFLARYASNH